MKKFIAIVTASFMEAIGFIGFACGLLGIALTDMSTARVAGIITGVTLVIFVCICAYLEMNKSHGSRHNKEPKRTVSCGYSAHIYDIKITEFESQKAVERNLCA